MFNHPPDYVYQFFCHLDRKSHLDIQSKRPWWIEGKRGGHIKNKCICEYQKLEAKSEVRLELKRPRVASH